MSNAKHFIIATAGHVDHGKSALVKALTGTDPDRLPEEKARGITIDLGFAHLELTPPGSERPLRLGIVDVPGHEDFVKNMVAGVGAVDLALLMVAADDGWMPQTEEHLQILTYFGVRRAVVALTKTDMAEDEEAAVSEVRRRLHGSVLADAPIVPTSVVTNRGIDALKSTLIDVLSTAPLPRDTGKPRLAIDRVFTLPGTGTVVTGTLVGGVLKRGQSVVLQPSGRPARIRRIQSHGEDVETSGPGTRTALNLADVNTVEDVHRGNVVTLAELGGSSDCLDVMLEISPRATRPLKDGVRIRVHYGSGNVAAHVALGHRKELSVGDRAIAQLRLEAPAFVCAGDRVAVRDWSEQQTLAGAVVLDADADRKGFRSAPRQAWLERVAASLEQPAGFLAAHVERDIVVDGSSAFVKSPFGKTEIEAAAARLIDEGVAVGIGDNLVEAATWQAFEQRAAELVDEGHRLHSEHLGVPLTELRNMLGKEFHLDHLFDALMKRLLERGFARSGSAIRRSAHRARLPESLVASGEKLTHALEMRPLEPPSRKELTPDAASQRALRFLIEIGEVVEINAELVLSAGSVAAATALVQSHIHQHGPATVSDLRQALGSSRRVVVPLLEYLDRTFVTVRRGDKRALRPSEAPML